MCRFGDRTLHKQQGSLKLRVPLSEEPGNEEANDVQQDEEEELAPASFAADHMVDRRPFIIRFVGCNVQSWRETISSSTDVLKH
jgi:hypothetical protein